MKYMLTAIRYFSFASARGEPDKGHKFYAPRKYFKCAPPDKTDPEMASLSSSSIATNAFAWARGRTLRKGRLSKYLMNLKGLRGNKLRNREDSFIYFSAC